MAQLLKKKHPTMLIIFDPEEVNAHSIIVDGQLKLKAKRAQDKEETEIEKRENRNKVAINDNLSRKLVEKAYPLASFRIKDSIKNNSKKNPTHKIIYIECTQHDDSPTMPVLYKISDHKLNTKLTLQWIVKCKKCVKMINKHISKQIEMVLKDLPKQTDLIQPITELDVETAHNNHAETSKPTTEQKVDTALCSLSEAVDDFMTEVKKKVMATSNPYKALKVNKEAIAKEIGKFVTTCLNMLEVDSSSSESSSGGSSTECESDSDSSNDTEDDGENLQNLADGPSELKAKYSATALKLIEKQKKALENRNI
ncbi:hypothetical protein ACKWTF_002399 [Chironomus riparius]